MTTARQRMTEAAIRRALAAWRAEGLPVGGMELAPDGTIRILASAPAGPQAAPERGNSCDGKWGARKAGAK